MTVVWDKIQKLTDLFCCQKPNLTAPSTSVQKPLAINGFVVAEDFPVAPFEATYTKLIPFKDQQPAHSNFIGAWNAIAYRHQSIVDYDESFTASIRKLGPGPAQPHRYYQDRDLFGFFASGTSLFDAFAFGLYAIGLLVAAPGVPNANDRQIDWSFTSATFRKAFPKDPIVDVLTQIWDHPAYVDLRNVRNVLTHRVVPARHHRMSSGANLGRVNISLDETTTAKRRTDISDLLRIALNAAQAFVEPRC